MKTENGRFTSSSTSMLSLMRLEVKYLEKPLFDLLMTFLLWRLQGRKPMNAMVGKKKYWFSRTMLVIEQITIKAFGHSNKIIKSLESSVTIAINPDIHMKLVGRLMENLWIRKILGKGREIPTYTPCMQMLVIPTNLARSKLIKSWNY